MTYARLSEFIVDVLPNDSEELGAIMGDVLVQFLGSGDAFGSGGRFQTCFYVKCERTRLLIDCGASSLIAMKRFGVDPGAVDLILVTHLHGDHFGGIPFRCFFDKKIKYHLDYRTLVEHQARLGCHRLVLTHMSEDMLGHLEGLNVEYAEDGRVFVL